MSRVEALDLAVLRARLIVAVETTELEGSRSLQATVEADHLLDVLGLITAVVA